MISAKSMEIKDIDLHMMIFAWFMAFFIFHSIFVLKDNRYFVLMAPPVAYFMILGLSEISSRVKLRYKNKNITFPCTCGYINSYHAFINCHTNPPDIRIKQ